MARLGTRTHPYAPPRRTPFSSLSYIPPLFFLVAAVASALLCIWQYGQSSSSTTTSNPTILEGASSSFAAVRTSTSSTSSSSSAAAPAPLLSSSSSSSSELDPAALTTLSREELEQQLLHLAHEHKQAMSDLKKLKKSSKENEEVVEEAEKLSQEKDETIAALKEELEEQRGSGSISSSGSASGSRDAESDENETLTKRLNELEETIARLKEGMAKTDAADEEQQQEGEKETTAAAAAVAAAEVAVDPPRFLSSLPGWTPQHRFYILGGVLTRDQVDESLYLDAILAGRKMFTYVGNVFGVKGLDAAWKAGEKNNIADPTEIMNQGGKIYCQVSDGGHKKERVEAVVVPVHTTLDPNVNGQNEIIRCPVPDAVPQDKGDVEVTFYVKYGPKIITADKGEDAGKKSAQDAEKKEEDDEAFDVIFSLAVPRKTRLAGYLSYRPESSTLDPWKATPDNIHICVPGITSNFSGNLVDHTFEFLEYHLDNGVDHVHFGVNYEWGSPSMDSILRLLRPYIQEGRVSIMSTKSVVGPQFIGSEQPKMWHYNSCLYFAKGLATWVGIWDLDEWLIPGPDAGGVGKNKDKGKGGKGGKPKTIVETVDSIMASASQEGDNKDKDKKKKPLTAADVCHLRFTSFTGLWPRGRNEGNRKWNGQVFGHYKEKEATDTWQKSLVSARNTYFAGFHLPGACRAPGRDWATPLGWMEANHVDKDVMAMHHYRARFSGGGFAVTSEVVDDEYGMNYFPAVLEGLKKRKVDEIVLREVGYKPVMELDYVEGPTEEERAEAAAEMKKLREEERRRNEPQEMTTEEREDKEQHNLG